MEVINKNKIAGVVIAYNPGSSIVNNIQSYLNQIGFLYIIDNSLKSNDQIFSCFNSTSKISYLPQNKNIGVSAALNKAAVLSVQKGFKYLLTMDQDSRITEGMIEKMLLIDQDLEKIGIITPFFVNKYETQTIPKQPYSRILMEKTSGNLLNLEIYKKVGPFNEDFFIDYVDIEYCLRLNISGYEMIQANSAFLIHNEGALSERKFFFRKVYVWNHNPLRWFYKIRNLFYLRDLYIQNFPDFFKKEYKFYIKHFIKILLYEDKKFEKFKYIIKGYMAYRRKLVGIYDAAA